MVGIDNQTMQQLGVGVVRKAIAPGTDGCAGIEVAVGKRLMRLDKPSQRGS